MPEANTRAVEERSSALDAGAQVKRRVPTDAEGCKRRAQPGDMLAVNFTGWLHESGVEFDRSAALYGFRLGDHQVISGWEIGLTGCA